jgi:protein SCO1/2
VKICKRTGIIAIALATFVGTPAGARAQGGFTGARPMPEPGQAAAGKPGVLNEVRVDQKFDSQVPPDLAFVDEDGKDVRIGQYFGKRPIILALVYYECPMLCTQVVTGLVTSVGVLDMQAGQDYEVVVASIDPGEGPGLARGKKAAYLERLGQDGADRGWHFLTGKQPAIAALTDAVGFRYAYDPEIDQYAHAAVITVLTPEGRVSRYFFGIEYMSRDLRLGLVEASENRLGTAVDHALLLCYHYDPEAGRYGIAVMKLMRLGGVLTLAALGAFLFVALRRDRAARAAVAVPGVEDR